MSETALLICVEQGRLESEAVLMIESLREWGGARSETPVYAFAPRPGHHPSEETIERIESLGANFVGEPLVDRFAEYPTFNKVSVAAWAERELDHELLVFVDTDTVFFSEPAELTPGEWLAAARPVDRKIAGSKGKGKGEPFWQRMYETLGVESEPFVRTTVGETQIRAYWNTGLIAAKRSAGLFAAWEGALARLFDEGVVFKRWPHFMDQLSWAGITADIHDQVHVLPETYNYPLRHRLSLGSRASALELDEIVHMHYRLWFHLPDSLQEVVPPFDPAGERYRWLEQRLPLEPTVAHLD